MQQLTYCLSFPRDVYLVRYIDDEFHFMYIDPVKRPEIEKHSNCLPERKIYFVYNSLNINFTINYLILFSLLYKLVHKAFLICKENPFY